MRDGSHLEPRSSTFWLFAAFQVEQVELVRVAPLHAEALVLKEVVGSVAESDLDGQRRPLAHEVRAPRLQDQLSLVQEDVLRVFRTIEMEASFVHCHGSPAEEGQEENDSDEIQHQRQVEPDPPRNSALDSNARHKELFGKQYSKLGDMLGDVRPLGQATQLKPSSKQTIFNLNETLLVCAWGAEATGFTAEGLFSFGRTQVSTAPCPAEQLKQAV